MTPEQERLAQQRKLDARCLDCGEGMAATSRCFKCGSTRLHYIAHGSDEWTHCLGGGGGSVGVKRDTSKATAAARLVRQDPGKPAVSAAEAYPGTFGL